jgi:5-methylcytosine-specific restriction endonuclease McrA
MSRKRHLWASQDGLCFYCHIAVALDDATLDHFIPVSRGGGSRTRNLVMACKDCNGAKADFDPRLYGAFSARCTTRQNFIAVKRLQMLVIRRQLPPQ